MITMKEMKEKLSVRLAKFDTVADSNPVDFDYYEVHAVIFDMLNDFLSDTDEITGETYYEERTIRQRIVERLANFIGYDDKGAIAAAEILAMLK